MPASHKTPAGFAIVTGAAAGIGQAIAEQLETMGWRVAWVDSNAEALGKLSAAGPQVVMDVASSAGWQSLAMQLRSEWPRLDLLVNNAGVLMGGALQECPADQLTRLIDVNLKGVMLGCHTMAPWLVASRCLRPQPLAVRPGVVNVASIFAAASPPGFAAYSASKAGVLAFSESLRGELAPHGLNVTAAIPGVVQTGLFGRSWFSNNAYRAAADRFLANSQLTPLQVATATLRAAARGKACVVIGGRARRLWLLKRLLPGFVRSRIASRAMAELKPTSESPAPASSENANAHSLSSPTT